MIMQVPLAPPGVAQKSAAAEGRTEIYALYVGTLPKSRTLTSETFLVGTCLRG